MAAFLADILALDRPRLLVLLLGGIIFVKVGEPVLSAGCSIMWLTPAVRLRWTHMPNSPSPWAMVHTIHTPAPQTCGGHGTASILH